MKTRLILSKVMKDFTDRTPFFGEWEEMDTALDAVLLLGHGFLDRREARRDRKVRITPPCEQWGFQEPSLGFEATYPPGPVTISHLIQDTHGWRMLISEGEILDVPPMRINESTLVIRVERNVRHYFKDLIKRGLAPTVLNEQTARRGRWRQGSCLPALRCAPAA